MFKSKKPKTNLQDLDQLVRRQRVRKAAQMTKMRAEILIGMLSI